MNLSVSLRGKSNINNGELIKVIKKTISKAVLRPTFINFRRSHIRTSSGVFIVNFEHVSNLFLVFLLSTFNM